MYVSLNGTLVARRLAWVDQASVAAAVGFDGIDVVPDAVAEGSESVSSVLRRFRLRPAILWLPIEFRKDESTYQAALPGLDRACRVAVDIGCPRMTASIPPSASTPKSKLTATFRRRLRECSQVLSSYGMRLGLEFLGPLHLRRRFPHEFIFTMIETLDFAVSCGPNVGITLDSWHWHWSRATAADIASAGRDRIVHVQVADAPDIEPEAAIDTERLMPGEGVIDHDAFFQALRQIGYDDGVSPEVFGRGLDAMAPEEGARLGLESTRQVMQRAGVL